MAEHGNNRHTHGYTIGTAFVAKRNDDGQDGWRGQDIMASTIARIDKCS